jgi:predicted MPP superfamily phosphohydrolase
MRRLDAPGGVFAVQGDVESIPETRQVMAGTGVRVLVNEVERVRVRDRRVSVAGVELAYWSREARRTLAELERRRGPDDIRIALAHRPDVVLRLPPDGRVDLTVAGHTHGGQVQLPVVGPLTISSRVPRRVGAGGLHELDRRWIYVSRGVGAERGQALRLRLGAVPEVSLITLR